MFEKILFSLVCLCLLIILICRYVFPQLSKRQPVPFYLDYAQSIFPVLLLVFLIRAFIAEPFRIPSGSMLPTLEVGDFILVNKFSYGVRLPILHHKVVSLNSPQRGDIVVFRYPLDNTTSYIKRVIGLPGDRISYRNRKLFINGERVTTQSDADYLPFGARTKLNRYTQTVLAQSSETAANMVEFSILLNKSNRRFHPAQHWTVPDGHYFMMGDNRDNSADSRAWGFLPDENIIGQAFFIWMHYNSKKNGGFKFSRLGQNIKAKPVAINAQP